MIRECGPQTSGVAVPPEDVVLLVHGTFAGDSADVGTAWWQCGSRVSGQFERRLPQGTRLVRPGEVFHWSGENTERARIKAGRQLLNQLLQWERQGTAYHLVGHSHGGSVIWHALRLATLDGRQLKGLRSWNTVGTPFLHYRTRGAWNLANVFNLIVAAILIGPLLSLVAAMFRLGRAIVLAENHDLQIRSVEDAGYQAILRAPFLTLLEWLGVSITATDNGLRLGSYDPGQGDSLLHYLFCTYEGWVILAVVLLAGYAFLTLALFFLTPVLESLRIRSERRLEKKLLNTYRGRWLGLWSVEDEAINGLRATMDLSVSFIAHMSTRECIFLSDRLSLIARPYYWVMMPVFNRWIRPLLDSLVRSLVQKTAQGNNRPAAELVAVSPAPELPDCAHDYPSLPGWLDDRVIQTANVHARNLAPTLRQWLSAPSFVAQLFECGETLSDNELVHTSYFDHGEVLDLLAAHIAWGRGEPEYLQSFSRQRASLWQWLHRFKGSAGGQLPNLGDEGGLAGPGSLVVPRRRNAGRMFGAPGDALHRVRRAA